VSEQPSAPEPPSHREPEAEVSSEPAPARRAIIGLAFLLGGLAMIFIGWVWGCQSGIDAAFAGAVVVVGIVGAAAGGVMLGRLVFRR
jgi:hypothetical protein